MALDQQKIEQDLCIFIKENLVADDVTIEPATVLSDIGLDSFSTIEMVLFLERKFGIELPDEVLTPDNIASVTALTKCAISFTENN